MAAREHDDGPHVSMMMAAREHQHEAAFLQTAEWYRLTAEFAQIVFNHRCITWREIEHADRSILVS